MVPEGKGICCSFSKFYDNFENNRNNFEIFLTRKKHHPFKASLARIQIKFITTKPDVTGPVKPFASCYDLAEAHSANVALGALTRGEISNHLQNNNK
jgi:hypothetical protein